MIEAIVSCARTARLALALGLALPVVVAAVAPAEARAAELRLSLEASDGQPPTHLCIVTEGYDDALVPARTQKLAALQAMLCSLDGGCGESAWQASEGFYFDAGTANVGRATRDAAVDGKTLKASDPLLAGIEGLSWENNEHQCTYGSKTGCLPLFSFRGIDRPREAYLTCVENRTNPPGRRDRKASSRGLLVSLSGQGEESLQRVQIEGLQLNGKQLLVRTRRDVQGIDLVLRVLGGFYAPIGEVRFPASKLDQSLAIEPRCQWTTIGIPPIASPEWTEGGAGDPLDVVIGLELGGERDRRRKEGETLTAAEAHRAEHPGVRWPPPAARDTTATRSAPSCVSGSLQDTEIRVLIPYEPRDRKILTIASGKTEAGTGQPRWELEANWLGARPFSDEPRRPGAPPSRLNMSVRRLSFSWRVDDCLYPEGACPVAKIATSGLECRALTERVQPGGKCEYRCVQEGRSYVDFPTRIAFERMARPPLAASAAPGGAPRPGDAATGAADPTPAAPDAAPGGNAYLRWSIDIHTIDQQLDGFVEPQARAFVLDTSEWRSPFAGRERFPCELYREGSQRRKNCEEEVRRARAGAGAGGEDAGEVEALKEAICPRRGRHDDIYSIEFITGERTRHRVEIDNVLGCYDDDDEPRSAAPRSALPPVVKLPQVSCREPILYQYVGERPYHQDSVSIVDGALKLPHPMHSARAVSFSIAVLPASFQWVLAPKNLRYPVPGLLWAPAIEGSLVFRPRRPATRGWRFNIDLTVIGALRPVLAIGDEPGESAPVTPRHYYARWYLGGSFLTHWISVHQRTRLPNLAVAFGAGAQVGIGYPVLRQDVRRFDGPDPGLVAVRAEFRLRLGRHVEAAFSPRLMLADTALQYTTDFHGQPDARRSRGMVSLLLPAGLVFVW